MNSFSEEIVQSCREYDFSYSVFSEREAEEVLLEIESKFAKSGELPLWERVADAQSIYDEYAWKRLGKIIGEQPIIIFFDSRRDSGVLKIDNGSKISKILSNCTGFVFYITNVQISFLICFNDHDVLIGVGDIDIRNTEISNEL